MVTSCNPRGQRRAAARFAMDGGGRVPASAKQRAAVHGAGVAVHPLRGAPLGHGRHQLFATGRRKWWGVPVIPQDPLRSRLGASHWDAGLVDAPAAGPSPGEPGPAGVPSDAAAALIIRERSSLRPAARVRPSGMRHQVVLTSSGSSGHGAAAGYSSLPASLSPIGKRVGNLHAPDDLAGAQGFGPNSAAPQGGSTPHNQRIPNADAVRAVDVDGGQHVDRGR